jgi:hypothetical protein
LVGNKQVLATVVELEMSWAFTTSVEKIDGGQFAPLWARHLHFVDSYGFMATVGNNDKSPVLVYADSSTCVHEIWKGTGNGGNALYKS